VVLFASHEGPWSMLSLSVQRVLLRGSAQNTNKQCVNDPLLVPVPPCRRRVKPRALNGELR
jgi:hypothetical protein